MTGYFVYFRYLLLFASTVVKTGDLSSKLLLQVTVFMNLFIYFMRLVVRYFSKALIRFVTKQTGWFCKRICDYVLVSFLCDLGGIYRVCSPCSLGDLSFFRLLCNKSMDFLF